MAGYTGGSTAGGFAGAGQAGSEGADLAYKNKVAKIEAWALHLDAAERAKSGGGSEKPLPDYGRRYPEEKIDFSKTPGIPPAVKDTLQSYKNYAVASAMNGVSPVLKDYIDGAMRVYVTKEGKKAVDWTMFRNNKVLTDIENKARTNYKDPNNSDYLDLGKLNSNREAVDQARLLMDNLAKSKVQNPLNAGEGFLMFSKPYLGYDVKPFANEKVLTQAIQLFNSTYTGKEDQYKPGFWDTAAKAAEDAGGNVVKTLKETAPLPPGSDAWYFPGIGSVDKTSWNTMEGKGIVRFGAAGNNPEIKQGNTWIPATKEGFKKLGIKFPGEEPAPEKIPENKNYANVWLGKKVGLVSLGEKDIYDFNHTFPNFVISGSHFKGNRPIDPENLTYQPNVTGVYTGETYNPSEEDYKAIQDWTKLKQTERGKQLIEEKRLQDEKKKKDEGAFLTRPNLTVAIGSTGRIQNSIANEKTTKDIYNESLSPLLPKIG